MERNAREISRGSPSKRQGDGEGTLLGRRQLFGEDNMNFERLTAQKGRGRELQTQSQDDMKVEDKGVIQGSLSWRRLLFGGRQGP